MEGMYISHELLAITYYNNLCSGRCPAELSISTFEELGFSESNRPPSVNPLFITVPGYYVHIFIFVLHLSIQKFLQIEPQLHGWIVLNCLEVA